MAAAAMKLARGRGVGISTISVLCGVGVWWLVSLYFADAALLPSPPAVALSFIELTRSGALPAAIGATLMRVGAGYALGVAGGIATGLLLGHFRLLNDVFSPVFEFMKGLPPIALVPLMILWLGIGELPKFLIVAYIVWIIVTVGQERHL